MSDLTASDIEMNDCSSLAAWAKSTTATTNKKTKGKSKTIEERYQKKTPIEHILHRPESYIGSVQSDSQSVWVWSEENQRMVYQQITFVPGLFKIFGKTCGSYQIFQIYQVDWIT